MLVYLAGKYTQGNIEENIAVARKAAIDLWEKGYFVICPHLNTAHFEVDCKASYEDYMAGDLEMVKRVDAIVMLPNWVDSPGAKRELRHAARNGVPIYFYPEALPPLQTAHHIARALGKMARTINFRNDTYAEVV